MFRQFASLTLLAAFVVGACSGGYPQAQNPGAGNSGGSPPPPVVTPPPVSDSRYYFGPYLGDLMGLGAVVPDYRGCDGFVMMANGRCGSLFVDGEYMDGRLVDGEFRMVDRIEHGAIVDFIYELSHTGIRIDIQHAVIGPVEAVDAAHARLTVLGQTVHVTDVSTGFALSAQDGVPDVGRLNVGDNVMVSGYFNGAGEILATLVERKTTEGPLLLRGVLASAANGALRVGPTELDMTGADLDGFPGGAPLPGDAVLLLADDEPQGGVLRVVKARFASIDDRGAGTHIVTGFLTTVMQDGSFEVQGHGFFSYPCGECDLLDASGRRLANGTFVQVTRSTSGVAVVSLAWSTGITTSLVGPIDVVDTNAGTLSVLGFQVQTTPATYLNRSAGGSASTGLDRAQLGDFAVGETVDVTGGMVDNRVVVDRIGQSDAGSQIRARRFELDDPAVKFAGRRIQTDELTTVLACSLYEDWCNPANTTWLFGDAGLRPVLLVVDVEKDGAELRATKIAGYVYSY